ncbi:hypothetical protein NQ314_019009 [Rhamnusium bicolor]|uniref:Uncharacterized protein n=1 Tax=Rhamnusium bicolor TaxID=1586634 RepID=A0AAV8WNQ8_9CUCU|nr:hypothetical protein NQ314_019009 [Rhamnusium bicolor]
MFHFIGTFISDDTSNFFYVQTYNLQKRVQTIFDVASETQSGNLQQLPAALARNNEKVSQNVHNRWKYIPTDMLHCYFSVLCNAVCSKSRNASKIFL